MKPSLQIATLLVVFGLATVIFLWCPKIYVKQLNTGYLSGGKYLKNKTSSSINIRTSNISGSGQSAHAHVDIINSFRPTNTFTGKQEMIISHEGIHLATSPDRVCTQQERLSHIRDICELNKKHLSSSPAPTYIVDHRHNILMGDIPKGGSTAIKMLLVEGSGYKDLKGKPVKLDSDLGMIHRPTFLRQRNLTRISELTDSDAANVLKNYFSFMLVRHPLERLLSAYRGKIVAPDSEYGSSHVVDILKMFNADLFRRNQTIASMRLPQRTIGPPSFKQFVTWLNMTHTGNHHWRSITRSLNPCAVDWSAVMRLETLNHDGKLLLDKLRPDVEYDTIPVRHSHQNTTMKDHLSIRLPEYGGIPKDVIDYVLELYQLDMEMFGYKWNRRTKVASCSIDTASGPCC